MQSEAAHRRIRTALRAELKRRHGQIGQIEADLDRSEGYLSRFCRGDMELSLKGCFEVLEAMDIEPGSFFSAAFGAAISSESVLRRLAGKPKDRAVNALDQAIEWLGDESDAEDGKDESNRRLHRASADELKDEPVDVQIRRLRSSKKYRNEAFVEEYLDWLETLRFDEPRPASRLVVAALQHVVPLVVGTRRRRIELFCKGLATFAACARAQDELRSAFWAVLQGLKLADAVNFPRARALLLTRAGAYCAAIPDYETGLQFSREAVELAVEVSDDRLVGIVLAARALLQLYSGRETSARRGFERSLDLLQDSVDAEARRSRLAAYSGLVNLCTNSGRQDEARFWLSQAISNFRSDGGLLLGKLLWQKGTLDRASGDVVAAIQCYQKALEHLEAGTVVDCALVSVELASALLESGRRSEAMLIAKGMASLADSSLRENQVVQAALVEFLRVVLNGGLSEALLSELRVCLEEGGRSRRSAHKN